MAEDVAVAVGAGMAAASDAIGSGDTSVVVPDVERRLINMCSWRFDGTGRNARVVPRVCSMSDTNRMRL